MYFKFHWPANRQARRNVGQAYTFDFRHKSLDLSTFWDFTIKFSPISIKTVGILYDFPKKAV
jgi:hypothetical protein